MLPSVSTSSSLLRPGGLGSGGRGSQGDGGSTPGSLQHTVYHAVQQNFFQTLSGLIVLSWEGSSIITPPAPSVPQAQGRVQVWWALKVYPTIGTPPLRTRIQAYKYTIRSRDLEGTCAREGALQLKPHQLHGKSNSDQTCLYTSKSQLQTGASYFPWSCCASG